ncbi:hypothetical protein D3C81_173870 [compost metagenome]
MNWKESYNDICTELRIVQIHEMEIRRRVELAHDMLFSGKIQSSGDYCHIPLDKGIEKYNAEVKELDVAQAETNRLQKIKNDMEAEMVKFTGLANVIQCKRIEGKSYKVIAAELGYSEGYLRRHMSESGNKQVTQSAKAS